MRTRTTLTLAASIALSTFLAMPPAAHAAPGDDVAPTETSLNAPTTVEADRLVAPTAGDVVFVDGPASTSSRVELAKADRIPSNLPADVPENASAQSLLPGQSVPSGDIAGDDGSIVITEILFNPASVYDSRGEWFEIANTTDRTIDLSGWTFGDEIYDVHTIGSLSIGAGQRRVLSRYGDVGRNGGVAADYVYGDSVLLFNIGDRIVLRDRNRVAVDIVDYSLESFAKPSGKSISLREGGGVLASIDNSNGANWCLATTTLPAGDFGSPGRVNQCNASSAKLIISEILNNPKLSSDSSGEWFEVYNAGSAKVDLINFAVQDDDGERFVVDRSIVVAPGGYATLGTNDDRAFNGNVAISFDYGDDMRLHNTFDEVVLLDAKGIQVDAIRYDDGRTFPDPDGASMQLRSLGLGSSSRAQGASWCESTSRWASSDLGTPGRVGVCDGDALPQVVITEVMFDPERTTSERDGEWFELANLSTTPAVLDGFLLRTRETEHVIGRLTIPATSRVVLAVNGDPAINGGVVPKYVYGDTVPLYNTSSVLELLSPNAVSVDRVEWSATYGFPMEPGHSMELGSTSLDNELGANWCSTTARYGAGDFGTPGVAGACVDPRAPAPLRISEVLRDPAVVFDSLGEWFEIYNPTADPVDLWNWSVSDEGSEHHVITAHVVVPADGVVVIARSGDLTKNGGVDADYVIGNAMSLINSGDELLLHDRHGALVDRLAWTTPDLRPAPNGGSVSRSMAAMRTLSPNDDVSQWCATSTQFGAGDRGTPGAHNDCVATPNHQISINEIHRDPQSVPDAQGEWIELHNSGDDPVDISGWTLRDDDVDTYQFPADAPIVIEAGGYLVAGRNGSNINGGIAMDVVIGVDLVLFNTADELMLLDRDLAVIDRVAWTADNGFPKVPGATMALRDPSLDNALGASWCASVTDQGNGDLGTPGALNVCELPPDPPVLQPTTLTHSLFATGSAVCQGNVQLNGSQIYVGTPVRSNEDISVSGSQMTFAGQISYADQAQLGSGIVTTGVVRESGVQALPFGWAFQDFAPGGPRAVAAGANYYVHEGGLKLSGQGVELPAGVHYVTGDVKLSGSQVLLNEITIVATGDIQISSSQISLRSFAADLPALMSGRSDCLSQGVKLSGSSVSAVGAIFAPTSKVSIDASLINVNDGAVVGSSIALGGSKVIINQRLAYVRVTAMCKGSGAIAGQYQFRVRHEGTSTGSFAYDLRVGSTVHYSGTIVAGETQLVWLPDSVKGVKVISTGNWVNEYDGTASSNGKSC